VTLVEEGDDLVTLLEESDARADLDNLARAVGGGNLGEVKGEGVETLCCREVLEPQDHTTNPFSGPGIGKLLTLAMARSR
jgi:hypothetical protein